MQNRLRFDLQKIPFCGRLFHQVNNDLKTTCFPFAMQNILATLNTRLVIHPYSQKTQDVLQKKGVIIIFNHPYEFETIATIAALPKRNDIYIIITKHFLGLCERLDKHLLPVNIDHHAEKEKTRKLGGILTNLLHLRPKIIESDARLFNRNTIAKAARIVNDGGIVAMNPHGPRTVTQRWFDGIGYIVSAVKPASNRFVVFSYICGTSNWDYLRLIPYFGYALPTISITFSKPVSLRSICRYTSDPKKIKNYLERLYNNWINTVLT